jgi:hypothetical protein
MSFQKLSLGDKHTPLVMRWRDDQLTALVDRLMPWLSDGLTNKMQLAVASVARSIVVEDIITGKGVHYARAKDRYRHPKRYRDGDSLFTWFYITRAMDILRHAGLIDHTEGIWLPGTKGYQSVARASDELVSLLKPLIDVSEPRGLPKNAETIVLRDREHKLDIDYVDTPDTVMMREQLRILNDKLAQLELRHRGQHIGIPTIRRIFNGSFDRGGRLYCHGSSYQNMPAEQRREIEFVIDGTAHPAVEIDYAGLHIRMAYLEASKRVPPGDPYTIDGFDRSLVKLAVNTLFNAATKKSAIHAIAWDLYNDQGPTEVECHTQAQRVVSAIRRKHHRIKRFFGSDCGSRFQRQDSNMAVRVLNKMIQRTGRCPLPMHDSFLVPEIDADILSETMMDVAGDYGLQLDLKDSRDHHPSLGPSLHSSYPFPSRAPFLSFHTFPSSSPFIASLSLPSIPSLFIMEVTSLDLRRFGRGVWWKEASLMAHDAITDTPGTGISALVPTQRPQRPKCHSPPASAVDGDQRGDAYGDDLHGVLYAVL